jgi:hypothetical protein
MGTQRMRKPKPYDRKRGLHPNHQELYTPFTRQVVLLFERMRDEHGTWRDVAYLTDTRLKVLRLARNGSRKAISIKLMDRMIQGTGVGSLDDFTWFTPEDLVKLGIWEDVEEALDRWIKADDDAA